MPGSKQSQLVGVIGPAGFGGSYLSAELIRRGHTVVGISRNPQSFGIHNNYVPRPLDIEESTIAELADSFRDLDTLVSEYGPHTQGATALQYMPFIEVVRKLILAVKLSAVKYFVFVGGAGSLVIPGTHESLADHSGFFPAYRKDIAESDAHVQYMEERLGPLGIALRSYRNARLAQRSGTATAAHIETIRNYEDSIRKDDQASDYIKAGRAALLFFEGNTSFPWTFVSPSPLYRPGPRTGSYEITIDYVPLKGKQKSENILEGRLTGISSADLGVAIADEIDSPRLVHKHWTASADLSDDTVYPSYLTADDI
ncbi:hypothetical protein ASPSYDRAFT_1164456 [Aspergillus sydowii CBS 593.65]|uniref:NAD(P)-binding domain-containing protein n=1 Tax=Aspergillus sydowii CBS 593.65 TaxID=1036612 RepID=A0A1L9T2G5_9EURO|nr:uncharacterized protein ASPSYDRAFT_1164456 [Aspergillus sydowii CBS 593.65]OJJ53626.1 hypothetical protein ASPSYDRAFT_1164456 [Aspergillus sydowii CBS 593.65]